MPLVIRGAPNLDSPAVGTLPCALGAFVEGWPLGWWLELPASSALIRQDDTAEPFDAREVIDRRFVQICESGPGYVTAAGDDSLEEWCFLDVHSVSSTGTRHLLDTSYWLAQQRAQDRAELARRAQEQRVARGLVTDGRADEPDESGEPDAADAADYDDLHAALHSLALDGMMTHDDADDADVGDDADYYSAGEASV